MNNTLYYECTDAEIILGPYRIDYRDLKSIAYDPKTGILVARVRDEDHDSPYAGMPPQDAWQIINNVAARLIDIDKAPRIRMTVPR